MCGVRIFACSKMSISNCNLCSSTLENSLILNFKRKRTTNSINICTYILHTATRVWKKVGTCHKICMNSYAAWHSNLKPSISCRYKHCLITFSHRWLCHVTHTITHRLILKPMQTKMHLWYMIMWLVLQ